VVRTAIWAARSRSTALEYSFNLQVINGGHERNDSTLNNRDVNHHKTLEQQPEQALLDVLLASAPVGFVYLDRELRFVRVNEQLAEINGCSIESHLGRTVAEILPTLDAPLREVTARILATGQPVLDHEFTGEMASAPGIPRHWNESWYPVRDKHGEIIGFAGVVVETTSRKQAEVALQLKNESLAIAVRVSKVILFQQDLELRYCWVLNTRTDMNTSEVIGQRDVDLMERPEEAATAEAIKREVMRSGIGNRQDIVIHIHNVARHYDLLVEPMRDAAGRISGVTCAAIDITDRKREEAAQRETDRNYRALADASSEIPYRMSADWSTMLPLDGRDYFASFNRPLADWAWLDQYHPQEEHARVRQLVSDAIARKGLLELEHRVLRADGSTGWVHSRAVPILDENEVIVTWFGAASDITERKRYEMALVEATAVAEKANQAKSDFLSSMSHELRTPLHAILGFAQLMESGVPAPTPTQGRNLKQIIKGGWYLQGLIEELLDLAQIESGKLSLTEELFSLADVMLECQAMIEPLACERGIVVTFPLFELPVYVRADRNRVKQVLINLLSNAIKYNKVQGTVTVEYALSPPGAIRISVRDTGEGLAPDKLALLFQSFNRLGRETGPEQGTGIGLVMCKRLVAMMGGTIGADSVVGEGSVFWIELKWSSTCTATPPG
jgi:PAS domain S-box-containing protein